LITVHVNIDNVLGQAKGRIGCYKIEGAEGDRSVHLLAVGVGVELRRQPRLSRTVAKGYPCPRYGLVGYNHRCPVKARVGGSQRLVRVIFQRERGYIELNRLGQSGDRRVAERGHDRSGAWDDRGRKRCPRIRYRRKHGHRDAAASDRNTHTPGLTDKHRINKGQAQHHEFSVLKRCVLIQLRCHPGHQLQVK
tara:strand:- start:4211 stop:4789 length:579 start_codon:yes stop_codon:yes gene_type:complete